MASGAGLLLLALACAPAGHAAAPPSATTPRPEAPPRAASAPPKYPSLAVPLSRDREFVRRAPAPDFWSLVPYYVGQDNDAGCSLASLAMLVNAARSESALDAEQPLVTQASLRRRVASAVWEQGLAPGGEGVTLDELGVLARQSLAAFGIGVRRLEVTHVAEATPDALARFRAALAQSEASANDWMLVNFLAGSYVGSGDYGHIAPVGAYDAEHRRVLVLDPDRTWYEPYWVPDEVALAGMATRDPVSGLPRGYLYVSRCELPGCQL